MADGEDGLDKVRSERPDLIVLDIMLPGLDGLSLCRMVRRDSEIVTLTRTEWNLLQCLATNAGKVMFTRGNGFSGSMRVQGGVLVMSNATFSAPVALTIANRDWTNWQHSMAVGTPDDALPGARRAAVTRPRPGHADLAGGLKYERQKFNQTAAGTGASLLLLAAIGLIIPALFHFTASDRGVAIVAAVERDGRQQLPHQADHDRDVDGNTGRVRLTQ